MELMKGISHGILSIINLTAGRKNSSVAKNSGLEMPLNVNCCIS